MKCRKCRFTHFRVKCFGQKSASVKSLTNFMSDFWPFLINFLSPWVKTFWQYFFVILRSPWVKTRENRGSFVLSSTDHKREPKFIPAQFYLDKYFMCICIYSLYFISKLTLEFSFPEYITQIVAIIFLQRCKEEIFSC